MPSLQLRKKQIFGSKQRLQIEGFFNLFFSFAQVRSREALPSLIHN